MYLYLAAAGACLSVAIFFLIVSFVLPLDAPFLGISIALFVFGTIFIIGLSKDMEDDWDPPRDRDIARDEPWQE